MCVCVCGGVLLDPFSFFGMRCVVVLSVFFSFSLPFPFAVLFPTGAWTKLTPLSAPTPARQEMELLQLLEELRVFDPNHSTNRAVVRGVHI